MAKQHTIEGYYNFDYIDLGFTEKELQNEWWHICNDDRNYNAKSSWNKLIKQFQFEEFYKKEIAMWKENPTYRGLPLRSWLYMNRKKYIGKGYGELSQQEIMRGFKIAGIHYGNSFHSPFYIKKFCKDFNINSVFDPCGGWGHRMLGAVAAGCTYHYNDINTVTMENCKKLASYLHIEDKVTFTDNDSSTYVSKDSYDAVFTCPPYHNLEVYSSKGAENLSYEDFLTWWKATVSNSIACEKCKYFAFIINDTYRESMIETVLSLGLTKIEEYELGFSKSHLTPDKQNHEHLIVFER